MIKLNTIEGFDVFFGAEKEEVNKRTHFITECGWSEEQFSSLKGTKWFCAHIEIRKAGVVLSDQYLGCCCYNSVKEFYTTYKNEYLKQMIDEGISEAKQYLPMEIKRAQKQADSAQLLLTNLVA